MSFRARKAFQKYESESEGSVGGGSPGDDEQASELFQERQGLNKVSVLFQDKLFLPHTFTCEYFIFPSLSRKILSCQTWATATSSSTTSRVAGMTRSR